MSRSPSSVPLAAIALASLAVILLEISYTRVFSYKLYYYFTYLILGIALLGGGTGGLLLATSRRLQDAAAPVTFAASCLLAGVAALAGYWLVARTQLNASMLARSITIGKVLNPAIVTAEGTKLVVVCLSLFAPFLAVGLAISKAFATRPQEIGRLYFVDLLGAGAGCALAVPLLTLLSPPQCVQLAGALFVVAGLLASRALVAVAVPVLLVLVATVVAPGLLPAPIPDKEKTLAQAEARHWEVQFTRWHPVFRVDVLPSPVDPNVLVLAHDGMWGAIMRRFDGDPSTVRYLDTDVRIIPFRLLAPQPEVAIIGAAGGHEVLAAYHYGARHITAIELNPVTVSLLRERYADFTGHLADDPRVTLVNAEGRSFLARYPGTFDLVWFVAPDSYAAMNAATSGAFVLSESYLYTAEMIRVALGRLAEGGILCAQFGELDFEHKPLRTVRYVATARAALHGMGIDDFARHVLVGTTSAGGPVYSTVLVSRTPFSDERVGQFEEAMRLVEGSKRRHPPAEGEGDTPLATIIGSPAAALDAWYRRYPFDVSPVTDDAPFFWHFMRFRDALGGQRVAFNPEEAVGERLIVVLLVVATVFAALGLLGPLAVRRAAWSGVPHALRFGPFFAAIGLGFMLLEVGLIQRLTLFLGYPTHTLTVTLCTLLVSAGIGSLLSARSQRGVGLLLPVTLALGGMVLFYCFGLAAALERVNVASFTLRLLVAVAVIFPLGLCLGTFMPLGLRTLANLSDRPAAHVAWAWAVNGFFSVVGSVLATILSMAFGFTTVFLGAGLLYAVAAATLFGVPRPAVTR